ncbi:hypothetical protein QWZ08_17780 [Ferruginibacter paludis]|uniref:hypothetical protein n=1 Tax=Ferruginibacter paludis TaxID=1310417 RepID=UPI0025B36C2C|nr:hypothetical protein [Ferruginibacter paludis]MDN3657507.1 hypothetical protein [Ferruginibacter paludis]
MIKKNCLYLLIFFTLPATLFSQVKLDSIPVISNPADTALRIKNLNPYFSLHVDSTLRYPLIINKDIAKYYWFLKNSPVGLKINKDNGELTFKAEKSFFLSGRLKYDYEYKVSLSVQNLDNPEERVDTSFVLLFYNTEIIPSKVKPTVTNTLFIDEGDTVSFKLQCDNGNFPIEEITYFSNYPIKSLTPVTKCNDDFTWRAPFDFIKDTDKDKIKKLEIYFIGTNKFNNRDTAIINIIVKESINYPQQVIEFEKLRTEIDHYVLQLKSSFRLVDKKIKKTKGTRTSFDLASASTALGGTVFSSLPGRSEQTAGKILPSVGVALVPVKEASAPNSSSDQNTATLIRNSIKRLEYLLADNTLAGEKDPNILTKSNKLKEELKQSQVQLIDIPIAEENLSQKELDDYFNNPKVNKKYKVKHKAN